MKIGGRLGLAEAVDPSILTARIDSLEAEAGEKVEASVRAARELRALFDAVEAPVVATDAVGNVTLCNSAAAKLLGAKADRLPGRPIQDVFTHEELIRLHESARSGVPAQSEVRTHGPEGVRVLEASASPLAGGGVAMTLRDVTELARAVQIKSDFVANASHELRTPITALRMAVDTLAEGADADAVMRSRLLTAVAANTGRLEEMVRDLLDLSRLESPEVAVTTGPVTLSELREALVPAFERPCREKRVTLTFDLTPDVDPIWTDRALLLLILRNLIENAVKFSHEGSEVRVTCRPTDAGGVGFDVIDRGIGIPLQHQQRIFERYYQVDAARTLSTQSRGTGLGLAIVKHAVRRLGGSVRLTSVWKQGTTVTVELPGGSAAEGSSPGSARMSFP
jgi:two-component system phosphate regulon sensor histidine kinase PhoR